jgi:hypothetical protein
MAYSIPPIIRMSILVHGIGTPVNRKQDAEDRLSAVPGDDRVSPALTREDAMDRITIILK